VEAVGEVTLGDGYVTRQVRACDRFVITLVDIRHGLSHDAGCLAAQPFAVIEGGFHLRQNLVHTEQSLSKHRGYTLLQTQHVMGSQDLRRKYNHRCIAGPLLGAHHPQDFKSIDLGHHQIQQH
jgi:hypothetical protein